MEGQIPQSSANLLSFLMDCWGSVHLTSQNRMMDIKGKRLMEDFISIPETYFFKAGAEILY